MNLNPFTWLREQARVHFLVEVTIDKRAFADALFGRGEMRCSYDLYTQCPVGKRQRQRAEKAVRALEADGWEGRVEDAWVPPLSDPSVGLLLVVAMLQVIARMAGLQSSSGVEPPTQGDGVE